MKYSILLLLLLFSCKNKNELSRLKIIDPKINIGDVKFGSVKKFHLKIKNIGNSDLVLKKIQPSCKCVVISSNKPLIIDPNETIDIILEYHAIEYGRSDETIVIYSNTKEKFSFVNINMNVI